MLTRGNEIPHFADWWDLELRIGSSCPRLANPASSGKPLGAGDHGIRSLSAHASHFCFSPKQ
jgi:hypothetical protein